MQPDTRTCIAYIAARIISGRREFLLYDYSRAMHIDMSGLPSRCLRQCGGVRKISLSDFDRGGRYRYTCGYGHFFDIAVHGSTFIGYVSNNSSHFIGNVRGDSIYLYDHAESSHFNFRMSRPVVGESDLSSVLTRCGLEDKERMYETR